MAEFLQIEKSFEEVVKKTDAIKNASRDFAINSVAGNMHMNQDCTISYKPNIECTGKKIEFAGDRNNKVLTPLAISQFGTKIGVPGGYL